jgi:hypothetical protein
MDGLKRQKLINRLIRTFITSLKKYKNQPNKNRRLRISNWCGCGGVASGTSSLSCSLTPASLKEV